MTLLPFIQAIALYESDSTIQPLKDAQQQSIFKMRAFWILQTLGPLDSLYIWNRKVTKKFSFVIP